MRESRKNYANKEQMLIDIRNDIKIITDCNDIQKAYGTARNVIRLYAEDDLSVLRRGGK